MLQFLMDLKPHKKFHENLMKMTSEWCAKYVQSTPSDLLSVSHG